MRGKDGQSYQLVLDDKLFSLDIEKETVSSRENLNISLKESLNHIYDLSNEYPIKVKLYDLKQQEPGADI